MKNKVHVKKVILFTFLAGKDRGKKGKIIKIMPFKRMVICRRNKYGNQACKNPEASTSRVVLYTKRHLFMPTR